MIPLEVVKMTRPNERAGSSCTTQDSIALCEVSGATSGDDARQRDVEARADDAALVDAAVELDDDLAGAVVVDLLELVDLRRQRGTR